MVPGANGKKPLSIAIEELYKGKVKILPQDETAEGSSAYKPASYPTSVPANNSYLSEDEEDPYEEDSYDGSAYEKDEYEKEDYDSRGYERSSAYDDGAYGEDNYGDSVYGKSQDSDEPDDSEKEIDDPEGEEASEADDLL